MCHLASSPSSYACPDVIGCSQFLHVYEVTEDELDSDFPFLVFRNGGVCDLLPSRFFTSFLRSFFED